MYHDIYDHPGVSFAVHSHISQNDWLLIIIVVVIIVLIGGRK